MIKNKFQPKNPPKPASATKLDTLVDYEQHGKIIYGIIRKELPNKFQIENENGDFLNLSLDRLHFYPEALANASISTLKSFSNSVKDHSAKINLEDLWRSFENKTTTKTFAEILKYLGNQHSLIEYAALRMALLLDRIYFKREKNGFSFKSEKEINDAKTIVAENLKEESARLALHLALRRILGGDTKITLPPSIEKIEKIAALGKKAEDSKQYAGMIDSLCEEAKICDHRTPIEDKAFSLLVKIGHIDQNHNLTPIRLGHPITFSTEVREEAQKIFQSFKTHSFAHRKEITGIKIITIDSNKTQDFDDALSIESNSDNHIVGIHITDVSEMIQEGTKLEEAAKRRATTIYCPDQIYPMLPDSLSEGVLSLKEGSKRPCISFYITLNANFEIIERDIQLTFLAVTKRRSYEEVDSCLTAKNNLPESDVLNRLWEITKALEKRRIDLGSTMFSRRDIAPELKNGKVKLVSNTDDTPARKLVSELAILANETAAGFAINKNLPFIFRSQAAPVDNIELAVSTIPDGPAREYARRSHLKRSETLTFPDTHFSLGLQAYTQVTSPIRRYLDLILVRQIRHFIQNSEIKYSSDDLEKIIEEIAPNLDEASLIQRERNRFWLLKYIEQLKVKQLEGTVVRIEGPRPLVEIDNISQIFSFLPNKKLEKYQTRLTLGEKITLDITKLIPHKDKFYLQETDQTA